MISLDIFTYVGIAFAVAVIIVMFSLCKTKGGCNNSAC